VQGAKLLASCAREYPGDEPLARVCMLRGLGVKLQEAHPDMPLISRALGYVLRSLREAGAEGASLAAQEVEDKLFAARDGASQKVAALLHQTLQQQSKLWRLNRASWLTFSSSSTVQLAFEVLTQKLHELMTVELRVLESRPLGEGVALAQRLQARGGVVALYPDMAMLQALDGCQAVLLGADAIFSDGSVRNKLGSALLAAIAKQNNIPVYIIAETWKITAELATSQQILSGEAAVPEGGGGLSAWVPLFDIVPSRDITAIVTEEGALDAKRLEKLSERRSMWSNRPFLVWGDNFEEA
jgi:translation initiation factor 2B subunit (eIF-2B alpha/beta/delta family)